ncbi:MAG: hypothetical protein M3Q47_14820, partial [Actinomycetota bacterium]|nr:hypothetical protein [Actinomycetota bacterium]
MADLSSLGARSLGVWTRREALRLLSAGGLDTLVRAGTWQVLWRGVYTDGGVVPDDAQRARAAVLATGGSGTAAGRTAARVWGLPLLDDEPVDDVAVPGHRPSQTWR